MEFEAFPKIGRLNRDCTITEKIDGTNAQLLFSEEGILLCGSRTRQIWPEGTEGKPKGCDNMGFAGWAYDNMSALFKTLGPGRHYGEWAGAGIQRRYDMTEKRFFLFNTKRWTLEALMTNGAYELGLDVVPLIYEGPFTTNICNNALEALRITGSGINSFPRPEGIMVYHHGLRVMAKATIVGDAGGKGKDDQSPS